MLKNAVLMIGCACRIFSSDGAVIHPMYNFDQEDLGRTSASKPSISEELGQSNTNASAPKIRYPKDSTAVDLNGEKSTISVDTSSSAFAAYCYPCDYPGMLSGSSNLSATFPFQPQLYMGEFGITYYYCPWLGSTQCPPTFAYWPTTTRWVF